MLKQINTTDVAEIQQLIERHNQGTGPAIFAQFQGRGSTELVAIRKTGKYLEGQYGSIHLKDKWEQVNRIFYETDGLKEAQSEQLLHQLSEHANLIITDQVNLHNHIAQLEKLLEEYRTFLINIDFKKDEEHRHKLILLERTYTLIGSNLPKGSVQNQEVSTP